MNHQLRNQRSTERKKILSAFQKALVAYSKHRGITEASVAVCYILEQELIVRVAQELTWVDVPAEKKFLSYLTVEAKKALGADYQICLDDRRQDTITY